MEIATKIVTILGAVGGIGGLFWILVGFTDYLQGRKNRDKNKQDEGLEAILYGAAVSAVSTGIAAAIITAMGGIQF